MNLEIGKYKAPAEKLQVIKIGSKKEKSKISQEEESSPLKKKEGVPKAVDLEQREKEIEYARSVLDWHITRFNETRNSINEFVLSDILESEEEDNLVDNEWRMMTDREIDLIKNKLTQLEKLGLRGKSIDWNVSNWCDNIKIEQQMIFHRLVTLKGIIKQLAKEIESSSFKLLDEERQQMKLGDLKVFEDEVKKIESEAPVVSKGVGKNFDAIQAIKYRIRSLEDDIKEVKKDEERSRLKGKIDKFKKMLFLLVHPATTVTMSGEDMREWMEKDDKKQEAIEYWKTEIEEIEEALKKVGTWKEKLDLVLGNFRIDLADTEELSAAEYKKYLEKKLNIAKQTLAARTMDLPVKYLKGFKESRGNKNVH